MIPLDSIFQAPPARKDRDSAFFSYTRSICPKCRKVIDAHIVLRDGRVWMQKKCPEHGYFEVEVSSDAEYYIRSLNYTKPGTMPLRFSAGKAAPNSAGEPRRAITSLRSGRGNVVPWG